MQPIGWYVSRLKTMSPAEIGWRVQTGVRSQLDRLAAPVRRRRRGIGHLLTPGAAADARGFRVTPLVAGCWAAARAESAEALWADALAGRAAELAEGRLTYFDLVAHALGSPIDWNRDHKSDRAAPLRAASTIDYRDFRVTGDCKQVWEPNRCHHWVVLARAAHATGKRAYAEAVATQWESWLEQCPFGVGMNWRSPLELAIRLINWVWAYDLIRDAGVIDAALRERVLRSVHWHLWDVARNYSRGSSAGNHLIGEAAGVFIGASYFSSFRRSAAWVRNAQALLEREIQRQTFDDGGSQEQALGYHLFITQFFLLSALVGEQCGTPFSEAYWTRLAKMIGFVAAIQAGGALPLYGDCDDGYVLDLGAARPDGAEFARVGAALFADRAKAAGCEAAQWLGLDQVSAPEAARQAFAAFSTDPTRSVAFADTGLYLLQAPLDGGAVSVTFDAGPMGLSPLCGHGHADALAITLRAFGEDVLVDPGTYDYFTYPEWRAYFRSTAAHNTVRVNGADQAEMRGPFLWMNQPRTRLIAAETRGAGGRVAAEHDGYARFGVTHRRDVSLEADGSRLEIRDEIRGARETDIEWFLHFGERCSVSLEGASDVRIMVAGRAARLHVDDRLQLELRKGTEGGFAGWISRGYHRRTATTTLVGRMRGDGVVALRSWLDLGGRS